MMPDLAGKVAMVTGAGQGIGEAIAQRLAADGCAVVLADKEPSPLGETTERLSSLGRTVHSVVADVTDRDEVEHMFHLADEVFGGIDILVNNAGIFGNARFEDLTDQQWHTMMAVNVGSVFVVSQLAARRWLAAKRPGSIINMSSVSAQVAFTDSSHYSASKAAVAALTRCVAVELGPHGIRANSIAAGIIETVMTAGALSEPELAAAWELRIPLRRNGSVEDVAALASFLASDDSSYINGEMIVIDGGASFSWPKPSDRER